MRYHDLNIAYAEHILENFRKHGLLNKNTCKDYLCIILNLSSSEAIYTTNIDNHPEIDWQWSYISYNPNLTREFFIKNIHQKWNWNTISSRKFIDTSLIDKYLYKPWNWIVISHNTSVVCTENFIEKHINQSWDWGYLSLNTNITLDFIDKYSYKTWSWYKISERNDLTIDFVIKYIKKIFNWDYIFRLSSIPFKDLVFLFKNYYINLTNSYISKTTLIYSLSKNPNFDFSVMIDNDDIEWCWSEISNNPRITLDVIQKFSDKPWNISRIIKNSNITLDSLLENTDIEIGCNYTSYTDIIDINLGKEVWIKKYRLEWIKALQIQRIWRKCTCDPTYKLAQKNINKFYES
tara:strand:+ start:799 stop:1845 length:1047 start_codon:yes stop_codon:yes gene_type:complete